jgi:hypothetical protein
MSANSKRELISSQPQVCVDGFPSSTAYSLFVSKNVRQMATGSRRNALNREIGADGLRDWSYGLFDCFSEWGICV